MRLLLLFSLAFALIAAPASAKTTKPTIVLVHGAFADASGWNAVTGQLQDDGYKVLAPPNPLRGVSADAAYMRSFLAQVQGTDRARRSLLRRRWSSPTPRPATPTSRRWSTSPRSRPPRATPCRPVGAWRPGALLGPDTLDIFNYPLPDGTVGQEGSIKPSAFREVFAADLPKKLTAVMAVSQRPASLVTLGRAVRRRRRGRAFRPTTWSRARTTRSAPSNERIMAKRIKAKTVEIKGASHVVFISHPKETTELILRAAKGR